ncbi:MAG: Nif11-like leader peptide family RiPP precursor [Chitinispirillia bacterium]|nr:Nif11-like leader peptide family RiPP precursor [Chitinispirillia bacterium]MCL2268974.1 Nif11-like leader peptide family RiPP precursor [Chitinispirillia bacterium]
MGLYEILKRFGDDEYFAAKYEALSEIEDMIELAKADGYNMTREEVESLLDRSGTGELTDDELALVASGSFRGMRALLPAGALSWADAVL